MNWKSFILATLCLTSFYGCNQSTSSSSETPKAQNVTQEMINLLASGFSISGIYSAGVGQLTTSMNCYDASCTTDAYVYVGYEESSSNPTKDAINQKFRYEPYNSGFSKYLSEVELGFSNTIKHYLLSSSLTGQVIPWETSGYCNVFFQFRPEDFIKTENEYEFTLDSTLLNQTALSSTLAVNFVGLMGLSAKSFTLKTDGVKPISYSIDFFPLTSSLYGNLDVHVEGVFLDFGADVIEPLTPIEGENYQILDAAFNKLRKYNFKLDVTLEARSLKVEVENGTTVLYDTYTKDVKTGSYGYYQKDSSSVQGITKIGQNIYPDGESISGVMHSILPTFEISSVFFKKSEGSTDSKQVFVYRDDIPQYGVSTDYGMFAGKHIGKLTITIEADKITIDNTLSLGNEKFVYYDFDKVSNTLNNLKENCNDLVWSQIASNQPEELEKLLDFIPKEALDSIPTIGGHYALINLNASYNLQKPVFVVSVDNYQEGEQVKQNYIAKLEENGFVEDASDKSSQQLFVKDCLINGETKKVGARIYLAADWFKATQFLIYPCIL